MSDKRKKAKVQDIVRTIGNAHQIANKDLQKPIGISDRFIAYDGVVLILDNGQTFKIKVEEI